MIYKKISLSKLMDTAVVGKQPTHSVVASSDDFKKKVYVGKLWLKESVHGAFLSGELATERTYEGKTFEGYSIVEDKYLQSLFDKIKNLEAMIPKTEMEKALDHAYGKPLENTNF